MRRYLLYTLLWTISLIASAQILKERRVYYLDCSYSMEQNGIWNKVRDNLIEAIENVSDETTELLVIPFACDNNGGIKNQMTALADEAGKQRLISGIKGLALNNSTMTYHDIPLNDFYNNRTETNRITYMFLMTDGMDEREEQIAKNQLFPQWGKKYGDRNVFGFYVILHDEGKNLELKKIIDRQKHLWMVETADVNINLVRLQTNAVFNAKNDKYFDIPIYGNYKQFEYEASFLNSSLYKVDDVKINNDKLRVYVKPKSASLPADSKNVLNVKMKGGRQFDFLVTEEISVNCVNKPERTLTISVR